MKARSDADIKGLIVAAIRNNTETDEIEFKDARGGIPEELWKSITGFSNKPSEGGVIVYGVTESHSTRSFEVTGITGLHELTERTTSYFNDLIINTERPDYRTFEIDGKNVLVVLVDALQEERKPCYNRRLGMDRGACIRDGNTDRPITDDELRNFIRNSSFFKYDLTSVTEMSIDLLNSSKIEKLLTEIGDRIGRQPQDNIPTDQNLLNMRIIARNGTVLSPTLAGALVFCTNDPQEIPQLSRYVIRCVRYSGSTLASDIIDVQDINGTLDQQIDGMQSFILRNIGRRARIEGTQRIQTYEYPELAIREIVANAVIHRDYHIDQSFTQIRVFDDRIEVSNPGNLPPGVTVDNIKDAQFSRNSVIATLMRDLNYLEEYGRGIDLVFDYMRQHELNRPVFRNVANMFTVTLLGSRFSSLSERQLAIWQIILNKNRVSAKDLADQVGLVSRPTIIGDLNKLIELGLVSPTGSGRSTLYELGNLSS